ncbi:MAG: PD-(D/E)XK nuclease family protein [Bacillota bacterium]
MTKHVTTHMSVQLGTDVALEVRRLLERVAARGARRDKVFIVSPSRAYQERFAEVLSSVLPGAYGEDWNLTYDGLAIKLLRKAGREPELWDGWREWILLRHIVRYFPYKSELASVSDTRGAVDGMLALFNHLRENAVEPKDLINVAAKTRSPRILDVARIYAEYDAEVRQRGGIGFSDLPRMLRSVDMQQLILPDFILKVLVEPERQPAPFVDAALSIAGDGAFIIHSPGHTTQGTDASGIISGNSPRVVSLGSGSDEALWLADSVRALISDGVSPDKVAIVLSGLSVDRLIKQYLDLFGVPRDEGGDPGPKGPCLAFVLDCLRAVQGDDESLVRVLSSPVVGIDSLDVKRLQYCSGTSGIRERIDRRMFRDPAGYERARSLVSLLSGPFDDPLEALFRVTNYEHLLRWCQNQKNAPAYFQQINIIIEMGVQIQGLTGEKDLGRFSEEIEYGITYFAPRIRTAAGQGIWFIRSGDAVGRYFEHIFIPAAVLRAYPGRRTGVYILDRHSQNALCALLGIPPHPSADEGQFLKHRALLFSGLLSAGRHSHISYARSYDGIHEELPSPYLPAPALNAALPNGAPKLTTSTLADRAVAAALHEDDRVILPAHFRLSASSLRAYLQCPRRFFYQRVLRLDVAPHHALSFGEAVHRCLFLLHKNPELQHCTSVNGVRDLAVLSLEQTVAEMRIDNALIVNRLRHRLMQVLERYIPLAYRWSAERAFVSLEKVFEVSHFGFTYSGRIDRIDLLPGGEAVVLDYKTGSSNASEKALIRQFMPDGDENWSPEDFQLPLYYLAASQLGYRPVCVSVIQLENITRYGTPFVREIWIGEDRGGCSITPAQMDRALEQMCKVSGEIFSGSFPARPSKPGNCSRCPYTFACPGQETDHG